MVRGSALPVVEQHPKRPDHALGGGDRRDQRVPQAVELRQRQYPRSSGPAHHLRARCTKLTRTEYDGAITVLAESFDGKRLTGPNDVVVKSDGTIWFSDNGAGSRGNYLGHTVPQEMPFRVYRLDSGKRRDDDRGRRHGAAERPRLLARREAALRRRHAGRRQDRDVYDVVDEARRRRTAASSSTACRACRRHTRATSQGNVWCGFSGGEGEDGVAVFAPDGTLIGRILLPERCANVCFGGSKRNRLFMAASQSVYALLCRGAGRDRRLAVQRGLQRRIERAARKRERSALVKGGGPLPPVPNSRKWREISRPASALPILASVNGRPLGGTTRRPLQAARGERDVGGDADIPGRSDRRSNHRRRRPSRRPAPSGHAADPAGGSAASRSTRHTSNPSRPATRYASSRTGQASARYRLRSRPRGPPPCGRGRQD